MNTNIIVAQFKNGQKKAVTHPAWLIDHGMVLSIEGVELPTDFEAHFSNSRNSVAATRVIGHEGQVEIPDELFASGAPIIYCWIYLRPAAWIGLTKYEITIPLQQRANVKSSEPTAEQVDIIDQAISALNAGVAEARAQADRAEQAAAQSGYLWFYIEAGRLYMDRTPNTQVDFYMQDGKLYVEEIA